jgi:uncharacterized membrane protein/uncharacterized RDD family membrane protein YckC
VIDPGQLGSDIVGNVVSLALPGVLWAALFLLAFEHGSFAASIGLGRRTFWLLLPGAIACTFADLPLLPVANDILGISFAGALFPILVGLLTLGFIAPPARRSTRMFLLGFAVLAGASLAVVLAVPKPWETDLGVLAVTVVVPVALVGLAPSRDALTARVALLLSVTGVALVLTFVFSAAVPGVGITEDFPEYLIPPILAGFLAVAAAPQFLPGEEALALPMAYLGSTFGVLVGADVLRQPPLYPSATPGLYIIGGAGVSDLVYLSGLLALATALVAHRLAGRGWAPVRGVPDPDPTPVGRLTRAFRTGVRGDLSGSLTAANRAAHEAAAQAHVLLGAPPAPTERPWQGLSVPGWVVADQANLDASATAGTNDGRESFRGWLMARSLVQLGNHLSSRRFASPMDRSVAFLIDLFVVTAPAVALWAILAATSGPAGFIGLLGSVGFNGAIYGYVAASFLYFVLGERWFGTTVGKWVRGLAVREREMRDPALLPILLRNAFRVPVLTIIGIGLAIATAFLFVPASSGFYSYGGIPLPLDAFAAFFFGGFVVVGVGLIGAIGALTIAATTERQRVGDLVAGTWVVRMARPARASSAGPAAAPPAPGSSG